MFNDKDFWKKVGWSFARAFLAVLIPGVIGLTGWVTSGVQDHHIHVQTLGWLVAATFVGAIAAGLRAVQAYFTNVEPGDENHGVQAKKKAAAVAAPPPAPPPPSVAAKAPQKKPKAP